MFTEFPDPIVVVAAAAPILPPRAASWSPGSPPGIWRTSALPVTFVLASPVTRDVGDAIGAELDVALRVWSLPACSAFRARYGGVSTGAPVTAGDLVSAIIVHEDAWPSALVPGAVAQTVVSVDDTGAIREADVHLNAVEWRFSLDGRTGTFDLRSVLVHEVGHALGLGHASDARATMAPNGSGTRWRSLEADDVAGVCALYPGAGDEGCAARACPDGYVCVGQTCQRRGERTELCAPCDPARAGACEGAGEDARCIDPTLLGLALGGSVCGRGCRTDGDCGRGFACLATTAAGDLQCVAVDACRAAASPCETDADCTTSRCVARACVGPTAPQPDAGVPSRSPPLPAPSALEPTGGACAHTTRGPGAIASGGLAAALVLLLAFRTRGATTSARRRSARGR